MTDILSNKYFLGATAIVFAGLVYYGYQTTGTADVETTASTETQTTATTVSNTEDGGTVNTDTENEGNADTTATTGTTEEGIEVTVEQFKSQFNVKTPVEIQGFFIQ